MGIHNVYETGRFAGGVAPNDFLRKICLAFGERDLTIEARQEALLVRSVVGAQS
jgi:hypothetical protein